MKKKEEKHRDQDNDTSKGYSAGQKPLGRCLGDMLSSPQGEHAILCHLHRTHSPFPSGGFCTQCCSDSSVSCPDIVREANIELSLLI